MHRLQTSPNQEPIQNLHEAYGRSYEDVGGERMNRELKGALIFILICAVTIFIIISGFRLIGNILEEEQCRELGSQGYDSYIHNAGFFNTGKACKINHLGRSFDADKNSIIETIELIRLNEIKNQRGKQ